MYPNRCTLMTFITLLPSQNSRRPWFLLLCFGSFAYMIAFDANAAHEGLHSPVPTRCSVLLRWFLDSRSGSPS